ncbi:hypothetical protein OG689_41775 [Kitasatospora sp. NBC_00240]|uniref:hypothetical protein n=1 Tax=Kitasatospora sp. NBC_00240 TaxID=2903567 RepID=UPI00224CA974|nr:hypothetical protein [Kitasatospora sp. NBC_00240]MCX5215688.1 hypothetical protein [Kitasatospora sp. NBC_00240]
MRGARRIGTAVAAAAALLAAGCTQSTSSQGEPSHAANPAPPTSAASQTGIVALGESTTTAHGAWSLSVAPFTEAEASAGAQVPAGWLALRTKVTLTNTTGQIAVLPETALTVRYGQAGRAGLQFTGEGLAGLPKRQDGVKVAPGAAFTAEVGVAVPPDASGQQSTVTAETTEEGLAEADAVFFDGQLPGTVSGAAGEPSPAGTSGGAVVPLGTWAASGIRVSTITVGAAQANGRDASLELTVANNRTEPRRALGVALLFFTGQQLTQAGTATPELDYPDAPIAPGHSATQTVKFTVPAGAVPGPLTVEAVNPDGTRTTFQGTLS